MSLSRFRGATYGIRKLSESKIMHKYSDVPSKRWGRLSDSDGVYRVADGGGYVRRVGSSRRSKQNGVAAIYGAPTVLHLS